MSEQTAGNGGGKSLKDRVGTAAIVVAAVGAAWYGVMSVLSAWVYEPVRVSPRDLGLSSSAILVQATVGLVVSVVIGVVAGAVLGGIWGAWVGGHAPEIQEAINKMPLPFGSDDPESNAAAAAWLQKKGLSQEEAEQAVRAYHNDVTAQGVDDIRAIMPANVTDDELAKFVGGFNRERLRMELRVGALLGAARVGVIMGIVGAVIVCLAAVLYFASNSRSAIQAGRATTFILGLPPPWPATVANVKRAPGSDPGATGPLPGCALFLGQNDSTVFLREGSGPTIRVPASTVRLDLRARNQC